VLTDMDKWTEIRCRVLADGRSMRSVQREFHLHWARHAEEAVASHEQARSLKEAIVRERPDDSHARSSLGATLNNLGMALAELGRSEDAAAAYLQAITLQRAALDKAPGVDRYRLFLSNHYRNLAKVQVTQGRPAEAADSARESQRVWPANKDQLFEVACTLAVKFNALWVLPHF
jgi:tetratricopeptide (TPR) repeat protein